MDVAAVEEDRTLMEIRSKVNPHRHLTKKDKVPKASLSRLLKIQLPKVQLKHVYVKSERRVVSLPSDLT